jgi:hypothetical protein
MTIECQFRQCAAALLVSSLCAAAVADDNSRPITGAKAVLAVYTKSHGLAANGLAPNRLIFAAWNDGYVVWSENVVEGGAPYRAGKIELARFQRTLAKLAADGLLNDEALRTPQFGPDASTTIIVAKSKFGDTMMQSWHELYEANGKVVATERGLTPLDGRSRLDALRKASSAYLVYRLAWNELRLGAASLIPIESHQVDGRLELRRGNAYWLEASAATQ